MSVTRINHFTAAPEKSEALYSFLTDLQVYITQSSGCITCEVLRQQDNNHRFVVIEKWESSECHQQSLAQFPAQQMQDAMALFGEPPHGASYC